ncbi:MAG: DNA polymerase I [Actinobacteria bacterium 69-20]|nr:MAG: DNA polymerase I [Actinobacteria bacterium 69-20]
MTMFSGGPYAPAGADPVLLLLDGHSLAYRAFHALPADRFATSTGQATNAVYGFTSMLINLLRDERPTHVAVAFDVSRHTWRTDEFAEYKAQRAASPEEFRGQVELIREVLAALRIETLSVEGFEADDIIATLATAAAAQGMSVRICTGDRDALQLVDDRVTVLYPVKGVSEMTRFTPEAVADKYGLTPVQYPDFAALRGDPSDNLPGIPGVGEKTAAKWIREYGSLGALVDHVDEVPGKVGDALRQNLSGVLMNRRLTELVRSVPLDRVPGDLAARPFDREAVHRIFDDLQFRVLRERLLDTFDDSETVDADGGFDVEGRILGTGEVGAWLARHATGRVAVICQGTFGSGGGDVHQVVLAAGDDHAATIDVASMGPDDDAALAAYFADAARPKVLHDAKPQINALAQRGWAVEGVACDTVLAAYLLLPGQRSFDVPDLVQRYLRRTIGDGGAGAGAQLALIADDAADTEVMATARALLDLATTLEAELAAAQQLSLLHDLEIPVMLVLARMERTGIAVNVNYLDELQSEFAEQAREAERAAYAAIGHEVNLGSPKQLQTVLFDELHMPSTKRTKTGYTTDAKALQALYEKTGHPFLGALLRHRDVTKLRTTVEGLVKSVDDAGRIHTTFLQTVAATGRLSSTEPNLQNVPVRTEAGRQIRAAFVAGPGFDGLVTADYSQIEMRVMAHMSGDEGLIDAFKSGEDLHTEVAMRAFGVPAAEVTPELRRRVKAMSYGLAYGLSAYGLSQQLGISVDEARAQMDAYFARFGGVRDYLHRIVDEARRTGYTETLLGRRRYLPELTSSNRQLREMAERVALNAPMQGSAADIIKLAMVGVQRRIDREGLRSRMLLQVHDELVCEVGTGEFDAIAAVLREEMGSAYQLSVPLEVSVGHGDSWDAAAH